jgi:hypothetical protein
MLSSVHTPFLWCDTFYWKKVVVTYGVNLILHVGKTSIYKIFIKLCGRGHWNINIQVGEHKLILGINILVQFCCGCDENFGSVLCFVLI